MQAHHLRKTLEDDLIRANTDQARMRKQAPSKLNHVHNRWRQDDPVAHQNAAKPFYPLDIESSQQNAIQQATGKHTFWTLVSFLWIRLL